MDMSIYEQGPFNQEIDPDFLAGLIEKQKERQPIVPREPEHVMRPEYTEQERREVLRKCYRTWHPHLDIGPFSIGCTISDPYISIFGFNILNPAIDIIRGLMDDDDEPRTY